MTSYIDTFNYLQTVPPTWLFQPVNHQQIRDRLESNFLSELPSADIADTSPASALMDVWAGDTYAMGLWHSAMAVATTPPYWSSSVLDNAGAWFGVDGRREEDEIDSEYQLRLLSLPHSSQLVTEAGIEAAVLVQFKSFLADVALSPNYATGTVNTFLLPKYKENDLLASEIEQVQDYVDANKVPIQRFAAQAGTRTEVLAAATINYFGSQISSDNAEIQVRAAALEWIQANYLLNNRLIHANLSEAMTLDGIRDIDFTALHLSTQVTTDNDSVPVADTGRSKSVAYWIDIEDTAKFDLTFNEVTIA